MHQQQQMHEAERSELLAEIRRQTRYYRHLLLFLYTIFAEGPLSGSWTQRQQQDQHPSILLLCAIAQHILARSRTQTMCRENYFQMKCEVCDKDLGTNTTLNLCQAGHSFENYELRLQGLDMCGQYICQFVSIHCILFLPACQALYPDELQQTLNNIGTIRGGMLWRTCSFSSERKLPCISTRVS
ncbi:hypothetical protein QL093DRAFT_2416497 [Fusarium oxysporum]|nr:hypothetical protein QL093DRAFT_2416497 [Fusarium oxysporum]